MSTHVKYPLGSTLASREQVAPRPPGGLLIATDGRPAADAAIIVGTSIAHRDIEPFELLAVEPIDDFDADVRTGGPRHDMHVRLALQRARTTNLTPETWPLSIAHGSVSSTIADLAEASRRRLIVLGLHVHSHFDRLLGRETVLRVMQRSVTPVLAVDSNRRTIPRRALAAIDFSPSSIAAAREALRVLGTSGVMYLVHVTPRIQVPFDGRAEADYEPDFLALLGDLRKKLDVPPHVATRDVLLHGDPAHELLGYAEQEGIELIATGRRGFSPLRGALVGRVPAALVRAARCSVLLGPGA